MKVFAINGSPRGKIGCTSKMLDPLLEGMREAGAETECIYLAEKKIHHCLGCLCCWVKTPGKCVINDDMTELIEKLGQADILVFGTPLYVFSMTGLMKNFLDRLLPMAEPWLVADKDNPNQTTHPMRLSKKMKLLLVSPAGFPEWSHFDALVATFKKYTDVICIEYLGEILRPAAGILGADNFFVRWKLRSYYANLEKAGKELIKLGKISKDTQEALKKDLLPGGAAAYRARANQYFEQQLKKLNE